MSERAKRARTSREQLERLRTAGIRIRAPEGEEASFAVLPAVLLERIVLSISRVDVLRTADIVALDLAHLALASRELRQHAYAGVREMVASAALCPVHAKLGCLLPVPGKVVGVSATNDGRKVSAAKRRVLEAVATVRAAQVAVLAASRTPAATPAAAAEQQQVAAAKYWGALLANVHALPMQDLRAASCLLATDFRSPYHTPYQYNSKPSNSVASAGALVLLHFGLTHAPPPNSALLQHPEIMMVAMRLAQRSKILWRRLARPLVEFTARSHYSHGTPAHMMTHMYDSAMGVSSAEECLHTRRRILPVLQCIRAELLARFGSARSWLAAFLALESAMCRDCWVVNYHMAVGISHVL